MGSPLQGVVEMNVALVIAGGTGSRMGQDIPKQFLNVFDKPIIIHTLLPFERHPDIDAIAVVCLDGWQTVLRAYAKQFSISKLKWIFDGGGTGQESIRNGLFGLRDSGCQGGDVILVHDGNRPLLSAEIISSNIATCRKYGSAVTGIPCHEAIFVSAGGSIAEAISIPREKLIRTQTPHTFSLKTLLEAHEEAKEKGIVNSVASCTLMAELGKGKMYMVPGSEKNIKITTLEDIAIFKALMSAEKDVWLKG